jgi:hypothetical protein
LTLSGFGPPGKAGRIEGCTLDGKIYTIQQNPFGILRQHFISELDQYIQNISLYNWLTVAYLCVAGLIQVYKLTEKIKIN